MKNTHKLKEILDSTFTNSFKHTADVLYSVKFIDSNVTNIISQLATLHSNICNGINTGRHVGYQIQVNDVELIQDTLNKLIQAYKEWYSTQVIPSNLKLYHMLAKLIETSQDIEPLIETVLNTVLKAAKTDRKLTYKEQVEALAEAKSKQTKFDIMKKSQNTKAEGSL
jgi:hypothetical protein